MPKRALRWLMLAGVCLACALTCSAAPDSCIAKVTRSGSGLVVEFIPGQAQVTNVDLVTNLEPLRESARLKNHSRYMQWLDAHSDMQLSVSTPTGECPPGQLFVDAGEALPDQSTEYWLVAYRTEGEQIWVQEAVDVTAVMVYGKPYWPGRNNPRYVTLGIWLGVIVVLAVIAILVVNRMRMRAALAALPKAQPEEEQDLAKFGVVWHEKQKKPIIVRVEPPKDD